jgi:hypothetical protein
MDLHECYETSQFRNQSGVWDTNTCSEWDHIDEDNSHAFTPEFLTLVVRTAFIFLEFGSRPLKNAKKILSCGLICLWLYHYRFGTSSFSSSSRIPRLQMLDRKIAAENATFVISFLILRLAIKMADLLKLFKTWKRLRIVKLLKLAKYDETPPALTQSSLFIRPSSRPTGAPA